MKLQFDPNLDYQLEAIEAACDLFRGQEVSRTEFTVTFQTPDNQQMLGYAESDLGVGNRLNLPEDELLKNLNEIQLRNGLPPSESLTSRDFTIEMETGTGKTYVYLRTILELNKRYGFTKFVIVVPSIAIKEGVYKTLEITEDHFRSLYAGVPYEYFLYDSKKLGQVRNFATSSTIQIMVVTVGAINKKDVNNIYEFSEKTGGEKPIDLIRATSPIIIIDEPQSVEGGLSGSGRKAIDKMNPLCTLGYSATLRNAYKMVYNLDAVDAYERKLVKQIEVASATVADAHNRPYVKLMSVSNKRGTISAKVELDVDAKGGVKRKPVTVFDGDDLEQTTGRAVYANHRVGTISVADDNDYMELRVPGGEYFLSPGDTHGDVDRLAVQRQMIHRTIEEHLKKETRLLDQGIKVLSLFFIENVADYRMYDDDGRPVKGELARIFEEEYQRLAKRPEFQTLFDGVDLSQAAEEVHNGYFSIDKKGKWTEIEYTKTGKRKNNATTRAADERAYNLIMKDKEKLLSKNEPLKFIFSHSALKEGWDNPNVFQICTLREMGSEVQRRQTIGRGLRLCVDQEGKRHHGFDPNTLTVVATESYEEFAKNLQKEIEKETGFQFGVVESHEFAVVTATAEDGSSERIGVEQSEVLWEHFQAMGYLDARGKVQDAVKIALKEDTLDVPEELEEHRDQIAAVLKKHVRGLEIKNADERRTVRPRRAVLDNPDFKELWDKIKYKTTYRVEFDNEALVVECIEALRKAPPIPRTRLQWRKAEVDIGQAGVEATEKEGAATTVLDEPNLELPDVLTQLQDETQLTRRTIYQVLTESRRLRDFERNPQAFIERAAEAINRCKRRALVDGIKYQRLGDDKYYAQKLFEEEELTGYLKNMLEETQKSVYEHVVYESETERRFADDLEKNQAVKVYAKLPGWFTVPTPLGTYNPDWAVLIERNGAERLYFVVETKGSVYQDDLRGKEYAKIHCGEEHFKTLRVAEPAAEYRVETSVEGLLSGVEG